MPYQFFMNFIKYIFSKYFFKQILNAIILTLFFILILYFYLNITTNHNKYINVPELDGVAFNEAIEILDENNLSFIVLDSALYNPEYPKFSVLDQMPKSNTQVKKNRKIVEMQNVNFIKHLKGVFIQFSKDNRLNPTHISLYIALFQIWNNNRFLEEFYINREEVMRFSKIQYRFHLSHYIEDN